MNSWCRLFFIAAVLLTYDLTSFASISNFFGSGGATQTCPRSCKQSESCCSEMGGINYCDASAGRYVCKNGYYSSCYCTRHAVMDLQQTQGCCIWQGGVLAIDQGLVICNNGGVSETCSEQAAAKESSSW